jgi:Co/Zn/Cd efflux system component
MVFNLTPKQKLTATIGISFLFFVAEIVVAFWTKSLALLADAFHYVSWTPISVGACVLHRQRANLSY